MTNVAELAGWLALAYASGLSLARTKAIVGRWCLEAGRPLMALFDLTAAELEAKLDLTPAERAAVQGLPGHLAGHASWCRQLMGAGVHILTRADPAYPATLARSLPPAEQPLLLYVRGQLPAPGVALAAIIGDQPVDTLAAEMAHDLTVLLAEEHIVLVGGLNGETGRQATDSNPPNCYGRAVLVAPMGISAVETDGDWAPALEQGRIALLSPFRPDAPYSEGNAVGRNRLITALADAVIVMQAQPGGVVHRMAADALRHGQRVCVWEADPDSADVVHCHRQLAEAGGMPVSEMTDLLEVVAILKAAARCRCADTDTEDVVYARESGNRVESGAMDPDQVLAILSHCGRVPEALRRRLQRS
jgi:predicted Rossmann fold nucleotide-binding protein DprA/Smf involved in DNA uptake